MNKIRLTIFFLICTFSQVHAQDADTTLPDLIPYRKGNLWGYCDNNKKVLIEPRYSYVTLFHNNYAEVWFDTTWVGAINNKGEVLIKAGKDTVLYVTDAGRVYKEIGKGAIEIGELSGNLFKLEKYYIHGAFTSKSYIAKSGKKSGVIDNKENVIIPFKYTYINYPDKSGYASVGVNRRSGVIDTLGKRAFPLLKKKYSLGVFSNGRAKIYTKDKPENEVGFINNTGKIVIPLIYKDANDFCDSISIVGNGIKYGAINFHGDTITPFAYDYISNFKNGKAWFRDSYKCGIIDKTGKEIFRTIGRRADYVYDDFIVVERVMPKYQINSVYGIMSIKGSEIWPFEYTKIYFQGNVLMYVLEKGSKQYYMDYKFNKYYED